MSEAISVPLSDPVIEGYPEEPNQQSYVAPLRPEVQGIPPGRIEKNATALEFDSTTCEELVDYIGQTAKYLGVEMDLVYSEQEGICFQFASAGEEDKFLDLMTEREEEAQQYLAKKYNSSNPSEASLFIFDEVTDQVLHGVRQSCPKEGNEEYEAYEFMSNHLILRLESAINENQRSIWGGGEFADKRNLYYFAGYLINRLIEGNSAV